jgi:hypothetical protein
MTGGGFNTCPEKINRANEKPRSDPGLLISAPSFRGAR